MADVILENLTKHYRNGIVAVNDLTLHVRDGELLVLVGPSGCGKTTTLRLIAGLENPTEGLIRIAGRTVNDVPPRDRNIAMVFQDDSLYPHMTVHQNMAFGLKMRGMKRVERDEKVKAAADALGITHLLERKPGDLSGGERRRAALGRALVRRPQCFLLDEPLSNLDPNMRMELREQIRILHRQINATTIYVTHDQEEAMTMGERVAVMHRGELLQVGTPMDLFHSPANRFVAGFIGSPAMNFISGRIISDRGLFFTDGHDVRLPIAPRHTVLLQYHAGKEIVAGIRPRSFVDALDASDDALPLSILVTSVEPLGYEALVRGRTTLGAMITAQIDARHRYQIERHATLCIDPEQVHYFEPGEIGENILCARAASAGAF